MGTIQKGASDCWIGLDMGSETLSCDPDAVRRSKTTFFWQDSQSVFELPAFAKGSLSMTDDYIDSGLSTEENQI